MIVTSILFLLSLFLIIIRLIGFTPYTIISSSMSPNINEGDIVYTKVEEFEELEKGDTITYKTESGSIFVTHRIVEIDKENKTVSTKGDNNKEIDSIPVKDENIVGKVIFRIPLIGYVSSFFRSDSGKTVYLALIITLFVLLLIPFKKQEEIK